MNRFVKVLLWLKYILDWIIFITKKTLNMTDEHCFYHDVSCSVDLSFHIHANDSKTQTDWEMQLNKIREDLFFLTLLRGVTPSRISCLFRHEIAFVLSLISALSHEKSRVILNHVDRISSNDYYNFGFDAKIDFAKSVIHLQNVI